MTDPGSDQPSGGRPPGPIEPSILLSEAVLNRWFGRLLKVIGMILGLGLWLLVAELVLLTRAG